MSKGLTYFLGIVTGILLTFGFFAVIAYTSKQDEEGDTKTEKQVKLPNGVTMLDTPVPFDEAKNFEIIQVVFDDAALANSGKKREYSGSIFYTDPVVLILSEQKTPSMMTKSLSVQKIAKSCGLVLTNIRLRWVFGKLFRSSVSSTLSKNYHILGR